MVLRRAGSCPLGREPKVLRLFLENGCNHRYGNKHNQGAKKRIRRVPTVARNQPMRKGWHDDRSGTNAAHHQTEGKTPTAIKPVGDHIAIR